MRPNDTTFPAEHILSNDNKHYLSAHSDNIKVRMVNSGLPFCGSAGKESACNAGDLGSVPGLRRSPGEGNSYPLTTTLAWRIPWTVQPMGSERVGHDWATFTFFMVHSPSQAHAARKMGVKIWTNAVHSRKYTHIEKLKRTPPPHIHFLQISQIHTCFIIGQMHCMKRK